MKLILSFLLLFLGQFLYAMNPLETPNPLHTAAKEGTLADLQAIMRTPHFNKEDVNSLNKDKFTPLMEAVLSRNGMDKINLLLVYGADMTINTPEGMSAIKILATKIDEYSRNIISMLERNVKKMHAQIPQEEIINVQISKDNLLDRLKLLK